MFNIGGRAIGPGLPCFIIAEAGVNHNGNLDRAHSLIDAAAKAGADAVKFQTWITERMCAPGAKMASYQRANVPNSSDQFTMLKGLELPFERHKELKEHAEASGLVFLSTPDDVDSARFLCDLGVPAIKIGSAELTNLPFLRELAQFKKPLILSTGMGTMEATRRAVKTIRESGDVPLSLLHCVSAYPAQEEEMNLRCISSMQQEFGVPVGLSDHTRGSLAAVLGVALGASILEKHLTLDHSLPGPDHTASLEPKEFAEMVNAVRMAERMLGSGVKVPTEVESSTLEAVQRTVLFARDLPAAHVLEASDLVALRCGLTGLTPDQMDGLIGRRLRGAVKKHKPVGLEHLL